MPTVPTSDPARSQSHNRERQNHARQHPRSIVARKQSHHDTLLARFQRLFLPWGRWDYPGIERGLMQVLGGGTASRGSVRAIRRGERRLSADDAECLAAFAESRCEQGRALINDLRTYVAARRANRRGCTDAARYGIAAAW